MTPTLIFPRYTNLPLNTGRKQCKVIAMKVGFSYLRKQFDNRTIDRILVGIKRMAMRTDFTLGREVGELEKRWALLCGTKHAVGVMSGTDALFLSLKALGIGTGDEV